MRALPLCYMRNTDGPLFPALPQRGGAPVCVGAFSLSGRQVVHDLANFDYFFPLRQEIIVPIIPVRPNSHRESLIEPQGVDGSNTVNPLAGRASASVRTKRDSHSKKSISP